MNAPLLWYLRLRKWKFSESSEFTSRVHDFPCRIHKFMSSI
uniref:Uncharacterized protein n=1 Tax=Anguilla anguilla TaxID=7936 RepID=A0A0E9VAF2_ANGAN